MDILINGATIEYIREGEKSLGEILGSLESACEKAGMTITGISVDGTRLAAEELDAYFTRSPEEVSVVSLETINGQDVISMLHDLGSEFSLCVGPLLEIPVQLQTGKEMAVMETINRFSVQLQNLYRLLPLLPIAGYPEGQPLVEDSPLTDVPGELSPILEELLSALKNKDTILVGDLSEYELAPRIEKIGAALCSIS